MQVAQQCKENIFAVQTLKDFQFVEDNKDQGLNVREKAKALVALLKDDERLKNERTRALKAKERFAQSTQGDHAPRWPRSDVPDVAGYHPDHHGSPMGSPGDDYHQRLKPDIELARYDDVRRELRAEKGHGGQMVQCRFKCKYYPFSRASPSPGPEPAPGYPRLGHAPDPYADIRCAE